MENKTSQKKIESNRRNARKSTGPKTLEGKSAVRFNALKHGILAKEVVIGFGGGNESRVKFTELLTQLRQELQPEGILEEMQVEKIATCYWRLRRAQRAEVGEIRKDLDNSLLRDDLEFNLGQAKFDEETQAFHKGAKELSRTWNSLVTLFDAQEKSGAEAHTSATEHTEEIDATESDGATSSHGLSETSHELLKIKIEELRDAKENRDG